MSYICLIHTDNFLGPGREGWKNGSEKKTSAMITLMKSYTMLTWDVYWAADVLHVHSLLYPKVGCFSTHSLGGLHADKFITMSLSSAMTLQQCTEKHTWNTHKKKKRKTAESRSYFYEGFRSSKMTDKEGRKWRAGKVTKVHWRKLQVEKQSCQVKHFKTIIFHQILTKWEGQIKKHLKEGG